MNDTTRVTVQQSSGSTRTWEDARSFDHLARSYGWEGAQARAREDERRDYLCGQWLDALRGSP